MKEYDKIANIKYYNATRNPLLNFVIKEKLDGSNFRFKFLSPTELQFGTRKIYNLEKSKNASHSRKKFDTYIRWIEDRVKGLEPPEDWEHLTFFGEAMRPHHIKYDVGDDWLFVGFDVFDDRTGYRADYEQLFKSLNLPYVPAIKSEKTLEALINWLTATDAKEYESVIDKKTEIEGFILVDYDTQSFYKWKTHKYAEESNGKKKGERKISKNNEIQSFFDKYFTTIRLEKIIFKMDEEGNYSRKNPMATLISRAIQDVFDEADPKDVVKTFGGMLRRPLRDKIVNELLDKIKELSR